MIKYIVVPNGKVYSEALFYHTEAEAQRYANRIGYMSRMFECELVDGVHFIDVVKYMPKMTYAVFLDGKESGVMYRNFAQARNQLVKKSNMYVSYEVYACLEIPQNRMTDEHRMNI